MKMITGMPLRYNLNYQLNTGGNRHMRGSGQVLKQQNLIMMPFTSQGVSIVSTKKKHSTGSLPCPKASENIVKMVSKSLAYALDVK